MQGVYDTLLAQRKLVYARYTWVAMHIVVSDMRVSMHIAVCATKKLE